MLCESNSKYNKITSLINGFLFASKIKSFRIFKEIQRQIDADDPVKYLRTRQKFERRCCQTLVLSLKCLVIVNIH